MDPTIYVPHFELSHTNPRPNPDQTDEYYRRPHPLNDRRLWSRSALIQPPEFPEDYSTLLSCLVNPRRPGVGGTSREHTVFNIKICWNPKFGCRIPSCRQ